MTAKSLAVVSDLDRYIAEINRHPVLNADEERRLALKWHEDGDVQAAHALVTANLRFVVKIANEYKGYDARVLDLVQEGSIGLMQAVRRFDPARGYRLLTYAVYWIRSYIHNFLMSSMRMIKLGTTRAHRKLFYKLRSLKGKIAASGDVDHSEMLDTVAKQVGVTRADVDEMDRHLSGHDASLDAPLAETGTTMVELMPTKGPNQEDTLADLEHNADRAARLDAALESLNPRERAIIEQRHLAEEPVQLKDIGTELGVSKQRVAQIERRAIDKLRLALQPAA